MFDEGSEVSPGERQRKSSRLFIVLADLSTGASITLAVSVLGVY